MSSRAVMDESAGMYSVRVPVKRLRKIWCNKSLRAAGYTRDSTVIVDNTPSCLSYNYGNAIYIDTYAGEATDDCLFVLIAYLKELVDVSRGGKSIRRIEKR